MTDNTTNNGGTDAGSGSALIAVGSPDEQADLPDEQADLPDELTESGDEDPGGGGAWAVAR